MFKKDKNVRRLSEKEVNQFENDGYLTGLPVFDKSASGYNNNNFSFVIKIEKRISNVTVLIIHIN